MSEYVSEFNGITLTVFFKYLSMGAGMSCLASITSIIAKKHQRPIAKYTLATILIIPLAIYLWWRTYVFIPRIGFSESFLAWELGVRYGLIALVAWWFASLASVMFTATKCHKKRALGIALGIMLGFFVGGLVVGRYQSFMGRGPVVPIHGFIIGPVLFGLIGDWIGKRQKTNESSKSVDAT